MTGSIKKCNTLNIYQKMKPSKTIFLTLVVIFSFTACFKTPTEGFKVEGSIANIQDCPSDRVMAIVPDGYNFNTKISESKLNNNYFSLFLPYELKDKYCATIGAEKYILFDPRFDTSQTISNINVKVSKILLNSDDKYYPDGNITQFGYSEKYSNGVADVTLVKTKYVYAQSAVSITGDYKIRLNVFGEDLYKTIKEDLFLQKGWNIIYYIGNYTSKPNTYFEEVDMAIINITTIKPENIELKWYYGFRENYRNILENDNVQFLYMWYIFSYYTDFILTF